MGWRHCIEILLFGTFALAVAALTIVGAVAAVRAFRSTAPLRRPYTPPTPSNVDKSSEAYKATVGAFWEDMRTRTSRYGKDLSDMVAPIRRDGIEHIKESQLWGRMVVQYALIGNGAGLAGLPYLMAQLSKYSITLGNAEWCAAWFAAGAASAVLCAVIAYVDFQMIATIMISDCDSMIERAKQRHFETETLELPDYLEMRNKLRAASGHTSLCGVGLAVLAWVALGIGAIRLIASISPN